MVILGANGAGKTTTLRAVSGMIEIDRAASCSTGRNRPGKKKADIVRNGVAHVPQGRGTLPELSVVDNLRVGAYIRKDKEIDADMAKWFEVYPVLHERRDQRAGSLSGGEQQMLAVSRALMSRPDLLLLDEPSLGLAPLIVQDLFQRFARSTTTPGRRCSWSSRTPSSHSASPTAATSSRPARSSCRATRTSLMDNDAIRKAYLGV